MPDASKADANNRTYAIYATRFGKADDWFPMVWADGDVEGRSVEELPQIVGAENVTARYRVLRTSSIHVISRRAHTPLLRLQAIRSLARPNTPTTA